MIAKDGLRSTSLRLPNLHPERPATRLEYASTNETRQHLDEVVAGGHYGSNNAAVVDAISRLWERLHQEDLEPATQLLSRTTRATHMSRRLNA